MSVRVMSRVWDHATRYAGGELLVLLALADWADDQGRCWPSVPQIARKARLTERQVYSIVAQMRRDGVLSGSSGGGRGRHTTYQINPEKFAGFTTTENPEVCDTETLKSDARNPEIQRMRINKNRHLTVRKATVKKQPPPTPSVPEGASALEPTPTLVPKPADAADRVMRECGFVGRRLRATISEAIVVAALSGSDPMETAQKMIDTWQGYQTWISDGLLRYVVGPHKFFAQAYWRDDTSWPVDQERLDNRRRAAAGTWGR